MNRIQITAETPALTAAIDAYEIATAAWLAEPTAANLAAMNTAWDAQQAAAKA